MTDQIKSINWTQVGLQIIVLIFFAGLAYGKLNELEKDVESKVDQKVFIEVVKRVDLNLIEIKQMLKENQK